MFVLAVLGVATGSVLLSLSNAAVVALAVVLLLAACRLDALRIAVLNLMAVGLVLLVASTLPGPPAWLLASLAPRALQFGFAVALAGLGPLLVSWLRGPA